MGRPPRPNVAGGLYHVIQRGNNRQLIFFEDGDRRAFLDRLQRCVRECGCRLHAYCLMSNHLHLLLHTERANLSRVGQRLFGGHTLWVNRKHRRVGHLFQGRFTSRLVAEDPYLLQVSRYIHLNPVKAGMVARPEDYPWSSLRAYLPGARGPRWVHTAATLAYFGGSRRSYVAFVQQGIGEEAGSGELAVEEAALPVSGPAEDAPAPAADVAQMVEEIVRDVAQASGLAMEALRRRYSRDPRVRAAKREAAALLRQRTDLSLRQIGQWLGGKPSTVIDWLRASARPTAKPNKPHA